MGGAVMGGAAAGTAAPRGDDNYFEDFAPGACFRHSRGKTVTEFDNVFLTHLVMNTAQGHFNEDFMSGTEFGQRITFGGITAALVIGLAMQDTGEQALAEVGLDNAVFPKPVFHGDTLYATSEVLSTGPGPDGSSGTVTFRHRGVNHADTVVFECERTVVLRRRTPVLDS
jgi:acyl dehydratase